MSMLTICLGFWLAFLDFTKTSLFQLRLFLRITKGLLKIFSNNLKIIIMFLTSFSRQRVKISRCRKNINDFARMESVCTFIDGWRCLIISISSVNETIEFVSVLFEYRKLSC